MGSEQIAVRLPSRVVLTEDAGMPTDCAATFDYLSVVSKSYLVERITQLASPRLHEACVAARGGSAETVGAGVQQGSGRGGAFSTGGHAEQGSGRVATRMIRGSTRPERGTVACDART
jgi:hypothetical protein